MTRKSMLAVALTAAAVALAFGAPAGAIVRNEGETVEALNERLLELNTAATNIRARAEAEKRDLSDDEQDEIGKIFASFEATEQQIERLNQVAAMQARMAVPNQRRTEPDGGNGNEPQNVAPNRTQAQEDGQRRRSTVPAQPRATDTGKWGFRSSAEYFNAVMQAGRQGGTVDPRLVANAATTYGQEGVGSDGGFAVPPDFRTAIVEKVMGEASLLSRTDQMTTSSNSITLPSDETTPWQSTGGIQANWEGEAATQGQSKPNLKEITVKANKLTALVPLTDELLEDAAGMAGYVNRKAPVKMDFKINDAIINGDGNGKPLGILSSAGLVTVTAESGQAVGTVLFENIVNMWTRLAPAAKAKAVWLANSDIEGQLLRMKFVDQGSGNAVPVYLPPGGLSASPFGMLMGRPVLTSEAMPALGSAGDLILGDMSQYLSVVKAGGIRQDVSIHCYFDQGVTAFRFVMRVGGQPWWNSAIARTGSQASRGFFVALGARD